MLHFNGNKLKCPYKGCEKSFEKPTVLTDSSIIPREDHYACPYCNSKINILVEEDMKIVGVKATEHPKVFESPAKCARFIGFLNSLQRDTTIPDECLTCPKILQCSIKGSL